MKIYGIIKRVLKNRLLINDNERVFLNRIKTSAERYINHFQNIDPKRNEKNYFFVEAIGVNQWLCLVQGLFGKAGELERYTPVIVMNKFVLKNKKVFSNLSIKDVKLVNLNVNIFDIIKSYFWASKVHKTIKTPEDLLKLSYGGIQIGDLIYSSYLFRYMTGTIFNITPDIKKYLRRCYLRCIYYDKLFKKYNPKFVILTNNTYIECGTLFQLAIKYEVPAYVAVWPASNKVSIKKFDQKNNLEDLCVVNPTTKEWEIITQNKKKGWVEAGKNWMEGRFRGEDTAFGGADAAVGKPMIPKKEICELFNIDGAKKVVLVCSHVMWDDPIIYTSLYRDYYWWWVETAKIANEIEDVVWVFKAHPGEIDTLGRRTDQTPIRSLDVLKEMKLKPHIKFLDSGLKFNNYSLMQVVDAVVTVRGTVGIEYACAGIPVITAGTAPYTYADFTVTCKSIEEYKNTLRNISKIERLSPDKIERALLFAYFYIGGGTSIKVKGTPDEFNINKLNDDFMNEFIKDDNWKNIMKKMIANEDCRKIYE